MRRPLGQPIKIAARLMGFVIVLCCSIAPAAPRSHTSPNERSRAPQATPPRFEEFPAARTFKGRPARPLISKNPQARAFRTRLREGARRGPNFAGHYTIVTWGCGTGCEQLAIVDAQTGRVYFPKALSTATYGFETNPEEAGLKYRLDSRLLVLVGTPGEEENLAGTFYYKWENNELKLIHSVKKQ